MDKPWENEPDYRKWIDRDTGYHCAIVRNTSIGHLCGYVRIPRNHSWHGKKYFHLPIECDGGLTFSGHPHRATGGLLRGHWFGFDCAHAWDYSPQFEITLKKHHRHSFGDPKNYRDFAYVTAEVERLARQLKDRT